MAYNQKNLLTDVNGKPIPQMYDQPNDMFIPMKQMEYYGKSTDTKPANISTPIGATFLEIDTKNVYINDGSAWVIF